jgi:hypothetical protein
MNFKPKAALTSGDLVNQPAVVSAGTAVRVQTDKDFEEKNESRRA